MLPLNDLLNLSEVPRWPVTRMTRQQNVAEHSFRTAVIAQHICNELGMPPETRRMCACWALIHDADETYGGDAPTPVKDAVGHDTYNAAKLDMIPWLHSDKQTVPPEVLAIVKLADVIEGYTWWQMFGDRNFVHKWIGPHGPIRHNVHTVAECARDKATTIGVDAGSMQNLALQVCMAILGGKTQL